MGVHPSFPFYIPGLPFFGFGIVFRLIFGVVGALVGAIRGRHVLGFILGLLLGPVGVGVIALFVAFSSGGSGSQCPECKKRLPKGVVGGCPNCGARF